MPPAKKSAAAEATAIAPVGHSIPPHGAGAEAVLAWAQAVTRDKIEKKGSASFGGGGKRAYFQEPAVFGIVKDLQMHRPFALVVSFRDPQRDGNWRGLTAVAELVDVTCEIGAPGRTLTATYPIEATDSQGWGFAKAQTYGSKYAIQKLLQIPTDAIPEAEIDAPAEQTTAQEVSKATAALKKDIAAAMKADEGFTNAFSIELGATYGVSKIADLPSVEAVVAMREWIAANTANGATPVAA